LHRADRADGHGDGQPVRLAPPPADPGRRRGAGGMMQTLHRTDGHAPFRRLSPTGVVIHPAAEVVHSTFEGCTEVGEGSRIVSSAFESYAYCDRFADIANTTVGRFANIAAMT